VLPVHNVPVLRVGLDAAHEIDPERLAGAIRSGLEEIELDGDACLAVAFGWHGDPEHSRLAAAGQGVVRALLPIRDKLKLLLVVIDGDIGKTFGRLLHREVNWPGKLVCIDGVELQELDYVDVGALIAPPGVVPVVIKSLLFA
jgi:ethanolamine utilization protein EutA